MFPNATNTRTHAAKRFSNGRGNRAKNEMEEKKKAELTDDVFRRRNVAREERAAARSTRTKLRAGREPDGDVCSSPARAAVAPTHVLLLYCTV